MTKTAKAPIAVKKAKRAEKPAESVELVKATRHAAEKEALKHPATEQEVLTALSKASGHKWTYQQVADAISKPLLACRVPVDKVAAKGWAKMTPARDTADHRRRFTLTAAGREALAALTPVKGIDTGEGHGIAV